MECKYLKTTDISFWHSDIYDHPDYKYSCVREKEKEQEIFPWTCKHCPYFKEKK